VRLRDIAYAYWKMRFFSWLAMTEQHVAVYTDTGMRVTLARFVNGRIYVPSVPEPPEIPDHVPEGWDQPPPMPPHTNN
jgi:hypothetical protein